MSNSKRIFMDTLRSRMLQLIKEKGDTYREASISIGKNENFFSNMHGHDKNASIDTLWDFCNYIGIEFSELFDFTDNDIVTKSEIFDEIKRIFGDRYHEAPDVLRKLEPEDIDYAERFVERFQKK